ncbi:MAG: signal recognition particle protein [Myxococcota bacterium]
MFEALTKGFKNARLKLSGKAELTEANISDALEDVRLSLLEADVEYGVVKRFLNAVKERAIGRVVKIKAGEKDGELELSPEEHFIKICHDELEALMSPADASLNFAPKGKETLIMLVGLQGSGKTLTAAKLANYLRGQGRRPLFVAADVYRPAAIEQLQTLGGRLDIPVFSDNSKKPPELCELALKNARGFSADTVIIDTAGRLAIDETLMTELEEIVGRVSPQNILLVTDSMTGQDAVRTASEFGRRLPLTGLVMTKLDGDARGGAALSVKAATGVPIKFLGVGEGLDRLEEFRPQGLASRILGFGDIVGLAKDFEKVVDEEEAERSAEKIFSGRFDFNDFIEQLGVMRGLGPLSELIEKIPFLSSVIPEGARIDEREFVKIEAMIQSMTEKERREPSLLNDSRIKRIARGCGRREFEVREMIERFKQMRKLFGQLGKGGGNLMNLIPGFSQLGKLSQLSGVNLEEIFGEAAEERFSSPMQFGAPGLRSGISRGGLARKKLLEKRKKEKLKKKAKQKQRKKKR